MSFVPTIGMNGIFDLKTPYDQLVTPKVLYAVRSIRTINDVLASGEQPFEAYYKNMGLDRPVYDKDFRANTLIIGLQAGTGEWIYVPLTYILRAPNQNGVKYSSVALGVSLGAIPDSFNLEGLKAEMQDLVLGAIGVKPTIKGMLLAQPAMISQEMHEQLERARLEKKTINQSSTSKIAELQGKLEEANSKISVLEKWIADNRTT